MAKIRNIKSIHVAPFGTGWAVQSSRGVRYTSTTYKTEALQFARVIAIYRRMELVIHGKNGKILARYNYASVPRIVKNKNPKRAKAA